MDEANSVGFLPENKIEQVLYDIGSISREKAKIFSRNMTLKDGKGNSHK